MADGPTLLKRFNLHTDKIYVTRPMTNVFVLYRWIPKEAFLYKTNVIVGKVPSFCEHRALETLVGRFSESHVERIEVCEMAQLLTLPLLHWVKSETYCINLEIIKVVACRRGKGAQSSCQLHVQTTYHCWQLLFLIFSFKHQLLCILW